MLLYKHFGAFFLCGMNIGNVPNNMSVCIYVHVVDAQNPVSGSEIKEAETILVKLNVPSS